MGGTLISWLVFFSPDRALLFCTYCEWQHSLFFFKEVCKAFVKNSFLLLLIATKINCQDIQTHPEQTVPVCSASNNSWGCDVFNIEHHFTDSTKLSFFSWTVPNQILLIVSLNAKKQECVPMIWTLLFCAYQKWHQLYWTSFISSTASFFKTVNCQQTVQRQCRHFIVTKRVVRHCSWINIYNWSKG